MRCELLAIGSELLLGQHIDTNSAWMGEQLALNGIDCYYQAKVGDNVQRIAECLRLALQRSDVVITCGGLGPTQDDITREAIALVADSPLIEDAEMVEHIEARFRQRQRPMPRSNRRQACRPQCAQFLPEHPGTAPGLRCPVGKGFIFAVPGVPAEMKAMVGGSIIEELRQRSGRQDVIRSRVLRTWGESESRIAELVAPRLETLDTAGNPTLAFLASGIEGIKVRITAKAASEAEALHLLDREEALLREVLGPLVFGVDAHSMEHCVLALLAERQLSLAVAECHATGGLLAMRLAAIETTQRQPFRGSVYCNDANSEHVLLGHIPAETPPQRAAQRARAVQRLFASDVGLCADWMPATAQDYSTEVVLAAAIGDHVHQSSLHLPSRATQLTSLSVISALDHLRRILTA